LSKGTFGKIDGTSTKTTFDPQNIYAIAPKAYNHIFHSHMVITVIRDMLNELNDAIKTLLLELMERNYLLIMLRFLIVQQFRTYLKVD
jgi:uncharacterized membrane protein